MMIVCVCMWYRRPTTAADDDVYVCVCVVQCVIQAVSSLQATYQQRAAKDDDWRASQLLSLLSDSSKIMMVAHTDSVRILI